MNPLDAEIIILNDRKIPEGAKDFRLTIRRKDDQPFVKNANPKLWVGIAYKTTLVKFKPVVDPSQSPRRLKVEIKDLEETWTPAPRAGDTLLVAVYLGDKPITAAAHLLVVELTQRIVVFTTHHRGIY